MAIDAQVSLGPVYLKVNDFRVMIPFYENIIGLKMINKDENVATFSANGRDPLLYLEEDKNAIKKPLRTTGLYHFALLLPTRKDLAVTLKHLIQSGYPLTGASDHLFSEAIYLSDPEGNGIEIYADRPRETWQRDEEGYIITTTNPLNVKNLLAEGGDVSWDGLPEQTIMGHIHLHVSHLETSEKFYIHTLGFEKQFHPKMKSLFQGQFVSAGGYHHHIGFNIWMGEGAKQPPENSLGMKFYTIQIPNSQSLDQVLQTLEEQQITFKPFQNGYLVKDPSGNGIVLKLK